MASVYREAAGEIAVLRFDRPPANAIELDSGQELENALTEIETDEDVGAVVITGTGDFFSAGLDLKVVPAYTVEQQRAMVTAINRLLGRLYGHPLPIVAAMNGHAIAGGLVMALACDYRVGRIEPCKIGLTEARVGIPYPAVAMSVVRAELSPAVARRLVLVARNYGPREALSEGVVDELRPADQVRPRAIEVARELAAMPRAAYARVKHQLRLEALARVEEIISSGNDPMLQSWLTPETGSAAASVLKQQR